MGSTLAGFAKQIVGMVNVIVLVAGVIGTALSLAMIFVSEKVADIILPFIKDFLDFGGSENQSTYAEIPQTLKQMGYILVAISAPLLVVGLLGCCGICFKKKPFLYLYTVVSLLICAGVITVIILWQQNTFDEKLFDKLGKDLRENYAGVDSLNQQSLLLNIIQVKMKCCGLENYTDFEEAKKWDRRYNYTDPEGQAHTVEQIVPATCCVLNGSFTDGFPTDLNCTIAPSSVNSYIEKSCRKAVSDALNDKEIIVIVVLSAIAAIEAISALLSIYLIVEMNKKEKKKKESASSPQDTKNPNGLSDNLQNPNNTYGASNFPTPHNPNDPMNPYNGLNPYSPSPNPYNASNSYASNPYLPFSPPDPRSSHDPYNNAYLQPNQNMMGNPYGIYGSTPEFGRSSDPFAINPYSRGMYDNPLSPRMSPIPSLPQARRSAGFPQVPMRRNPYQGWPGWRSGAPRRPPQFGAVKRFNPYSGATMPYGRFV